jgi:hypothetical protein
MPEAVESSAPIEELSLPQQYQLSESIRALAGLIAGTVNYMTIHASRRP